MHSHANNEENICGWANQNDINLDTIKLTNILKRKATEQLLPKLMITKNKIETLKRTQFSNTKLSNTKNIFYRQSYRINIKRQKTQGYDDDKKEQQQEQKQIKISEDRVNCPPIIISPYLTDYSQMKNHHRNSIPQHYQSSIKEEKEYKNKEKTSSTYKKIFNNKHINMKSYDFIHRNQQTKKDDSPKKTQAKFYVKLSSLEMMNDLKKEFKFDYLRDKGQKVCLSQERENKYEKNKRKKLGIQVLEKMNQKFKQTFTKKDIFNKNSKKLQSKFDKPHQITFSQNSIILDKSILNIKLQALKNANRYRIIFK